MASNRSLTGITIGGNVQQRTPIRMNLSDFANAVNKIDENAQKALEQRSAIAATLADVKLNEAEDEWKYNYIQDIQNQIDNAAQFGDYSTALNVATKLAGDAVSSPALRGRIRANDEYQKELETQKARVLNGKISEATYNWWLKNNPYSYSDIRNDNGDIVGGTTYTPAFRPVDDINFAGLATAAFNLIRPYKNSESSARQNSVGNQTGNVLVRDGVTYQPGEEIGGSRSSGSQIERVTEDEIKNTMAELLGATGDGYRQLEQAYNVYVSEITQMQEEYDNLSDADKSSAKGTNLQQMINTRKALMRKNGSDVDYDTFYARMIMDSLYARGLSYDWRTTTSDIRNSYGIGTPSGVSGGGKSSGGGQGNQGQPQTDNVEGPLVQQQIKTESASNGVSQAQQRILNTFNTSRK